jgi:glycosyltransferase involved in cell wall biosynthesis
MNNTAFVTIVSNNYLHFARSLMQSVAQHHPEADRFCVLVDRDISFIRYLSEEFDCLQLDQLNLPDGDDFYFQYNVLELNTAVKPWALAHLLGRGYENVCYIDPDIVLYRPLKDVFAEFVQGADLVLTPHLLSPVDDTHNPGELDIRRAGTYNLGFCALRNTNNVQSMLRWWQGKLQRDCIIAHDRGIFVDQSWIDLVPGLFQNVRILRHPGYNIAYWNIAQRPVTLEGDQVLVCGQPLVFFHFSGLNPMSPQSVSKYQDRFDLENIGAPIRKLIEDYCARVIELGLATYRGIPYGFGFYDDGVVIADEDRQRFRVSNELRAMALGKPFSNSALLSSRSAVQEPGGEQQFLGSVYWHFLGRKPDPDALNSFSGVDSGWLRRLKVVVAVGLSSEARMNPGWIIRMLVWPVQQYLQKECSVRVSAAPSPVAAVRVPVRSRDRPSPYAGLYAPEKDSATQGLWVGPRLDLPVCSTLEGRLILQGSVDFGLLRLGPQFAGFALEIHGEGGLIRRESIGRSGQFHLELMLPQGAISQGRQWSVIATAHVVPKALGLSEDTRALSWRLNLLSVDQFVLIDSARSPVALAVEELVQPEGLNLVGYLAAELGLGEAARSLARACVAAKIPFSAVDVGFQSQNKQRDTDLMGSAVKDRFPIDLLYVNADQTAETAAYLKSRGLQGGYRIGYWHWEQPRLPAVALGAFAHVDEVWVPSTFVFDAVAPYSPVPVVKIPHAIEFSPSPGLKRSDFGLPDGKVLVLVMYDFHSYQYRKNPQAAIASFRKAAAGRDDAVLVIKTINGHHHIAARQSLQDGVCDLSNVLFIDDFLTRQQTWDLQACCDILLSLHRAEGFGLAPAEMMYLGKPVVATGWSANTDFMTPDNSFLVRYSLKVLQEPVGVYPAGQFWAEADVDHAAECLECLLDDEVLRSELGRRAAKDIRAQLSPAVVGALVRQRLSLLDYWNPVLRK